MVVKDGDKIKCIAASQPFWWEFTEGKTYYCKNGRVSLNEDVAVGYSFFAAFKEGRPQGAHPLGFVIFHSETESEE
jgi:hypothetical protein